MGQLAGIDTKAGTKCTLLSIEQCHGHCLQAIKLLQLTQTNVMADWLVNANVSLSWAQGSFYVLQNACLTVALLQLDVPTSKYYKSVSDEHFQTYTNSPCDATPILCHESACASAFASDLDGHWLSLLELLRVSMCSSCGHRVFFHLLAPRSIEASDLMVGASADCHGGPRGPES